MIECPHILRNDRNVIDDLNNQIQMIVLKTQMHCVGAVATDSGITNLSTIF